MKISYKNNEYDIAVFADIRGESEELEKYGDIGYVNYLRVYKSMEVWIVYEVNPMCKNCTKYLKTCEGTVSMVYTGCVFKK